MKEITISVNEKSCNISVGFKGINGEGTTKDITPNEAIEIIKELRLALKVVADNA